MDAHTGGLQEGGFTLGLLAGTCVGAGLAMWLAPRASQAVGDLTRKGQPVRDDVADAVARGAHEVERRAVAARGDHTGDPVKRSA